MWRYRVVLTAGALLVFSLHMISAGVGRGGALALPAVHLLGALSPIQSATARLGEGATAVVSDYLDLVHVREENLKLRAELARITSERAQMAELKIENRHLADLLELKDALGMDAVAANVIGSDATGVSRTLILGQGSSSGLKPGMAVLCDQGIVGKIIEVSHHASRVLLIDDHNSALDGFDQRTRARGIVAGVVDDGLIMKYVDRTADVRVGDTVVSSGLDGIYPRGLLVGTIDRVRREGPGMFIRVEVKPAVDFRSLEQVLVVTQQPPKMPAEQRG